MVDLERVLDSLSRQRPVFHSEADFQHALAWQIHLTYPNVNIRPEYRPIPNEPLYLDIWVADDTGAQALELKYLTGPLTIQVNGERFTLINQAAQPVRRYDFIKDIARLEHVVEKVTNVVGYAIVLTNVSGYWIPTRHRDTVDAALRVHEGAVLTGTLAWSPEVGAGTSRKREAPLMLKGSYPIMWHDYSLAAAKQESSRFRYAIVRVAAAHDA